MIVVKRWMTALTAVAALATPAAVLPAAGQDGNITEPVAVIEAKLRDGVFQVLDQRASRGIQGERTSRTALSFEDGSMMVVKWAPAAPNAEAFNNQPRYEVAAYEVQKLFLDEADYVVPPTVIRAFPLEWYVALDPRASPTFRNTGSVLVTLQYWLFDVTGDDVWNEARFQTDTTYARHFADLNILTYLIRHNDANQGNLLISRSPGNPRVFAVDNGLAFSSVTSDRGATWRSMRVDRLPAGTVERLRSITLDDLRAALGILVQFEVGPSGVLTRVPPGENLATGRGVRHQDHTIQLGLTDREIREIWRRLEDLLKDIDRGEYEVF